MSDPLFFDPGPPQQQRGPRPVLESSPIDVHGGAFVELKKRISAWYVGEYYSNPGPIQFHGSTANDSTHSLQLRASDYVGRIGELRSLLDDISRKCLPGVSEPILDAAITGVKSLSHILDIIKSNN